MTDLVAFIEARLAEVERDARRALQFPYELPSDAPWAVARIHIERGAALSSDPHIARHDPARVLRDVEAKRLILARYEDAVARQTDPDYSLPAANAQAAEYEDWVLPPLAAPYTDHPDYRSEWSV